MFRGELAIQGRHPENASQKDVLTDETVNGLLSFVGNREAKIGVLVSMQPEKDYSERDLYAILPHEQLQAHPEDKRWVMNVPTPAFYSETSLIPAGMVEKTTVESKRFTGREIRAYRKTDAGVETGDAFGGLMLHFSSRHPNVSLEALLGGTNSSAKTFIEDDKGKREITKRSPAVRWAFYKALFDERITFPTRVIDVATIMKENPKLIGEHATRIGRNGIITSESSGYGVPVSAYRLAPQSEQAEKPPYFKEGYFPHVVYQAISENPQRWWTIDEVTTLLIKERPESILQGTDEKSRFENMKVQAANTLSKLRDNGHVVVEKFDTSILATVDLSKEQREVLEDFLAYIDAFQKQNPDALAFGASYAQQLRENPELLAELLLKSKEASSNVGKNAATTENTANAVSAILDTHPDMSTKQIRDILAREHNIILAPKTVRIYLDRMRHAGNVVAYPHKSGIQWRPSTKAPNT